MVYVLRSPVLHEPCGSRGFQGTTSKGTHAGALDALAAPFQGPRQGLVRRQLACVIPVNSYDKPNRAALD